MAIRCNACGQPFTSGSNHNCAELTRAATNLREALARQWSPQECVGDEPEPPATSTPTPAAFGGTDDQGLREFVSRMKRLPPDAARVLHENLWDLYLDADLPTPPATVREALARQFPPDPVDAFYAEYEKRTGRVDDLCDVLGHDDAEACMKAALAAADAGESEGPYFVTCVPDAECGDSWKVQRQEPHISGDPASFSFVLIVELFDKAEAVGVRNALNRVQGRTA